jgi:transposase
MTSTATAVIGGVDTHADTHYAAALDQVGRLLGTRQFTADAAGYRRLLEWLGGFGVVQCIGVEGTGCYGAGLTRFLRCHEVTVVEVNRPDRRARRLRGKSDPLDAENAARRVLAAQDAVIPKDTTTVVESIRVLRVARDGAVKARTAALNQLKDLITTAPDELRASLRGRRCGQLLSRSRGSAPTPLAWPTRRRPPRPRYAALVLELSTSTPKSLCSTRNCANWSQPRHRARWRCSRCPLSTPPSC